MTIKIKVFDTLYYLKTFFRIDFKRSKIITIDLPACGVYDCGIVSHEGKHCVRYWQTDRGGAGPEFVPLPRLGKKFELLDRVKKTDKAVEIAMYY